MANFNYKRGYSVEELESLLSKTKVEREKFLQSASDSGSSYSRIALQDVERKINGILDALEYLNLAKHCRRDYSLKDCNFTQNSLYSHIFSEMKHSLLDILKDYDKNPEFVDRVLVSAYADFNSLSIDKNLFLKSLLIKNNEIEETECLERFKKHYQHLEKFDFEILIELFEFVMSPIDRVINGAVYTPSNIRNFILESSLKKHNGNFEKMKVADISCGCGGFLIDIAKKIKSKTNLSYSKIFKDQIFALDIQDYSIKRTKILLSLLAILNGEDKKEFKFNLYVGDSLLFDWKLKIKNFLGFDLILGNPPYVCCRNLDLDTKERVKKWKVASSGNPDLYIPFFQIGIENLSKNGVLGFITMNSFFKSLNGRELRKYFNEKSLEMDILDFGAEQVFRSKNTYTCICIIKNKNKSFLRYSRALFNDPNSQKTPFEKIDYSVLDYKTGWNLQDNKEISEIESRGIPFSERFKTRHGIATLKNDVYIFKPISEDENYYYLDNENKCPIEKGICRDIVNANKLSRPVNLLDILEKIIFPYDNSDKAKIIPEDIFSKKYPKAYKYLSDNKNILAMRDKGKGRYAAWYAFGRTQSLEKYKYKLFFPKFSDRIPSFIISDDERLMFYNGQAVIGNSMKDLKLAKKIMKSDSFWDYIKKTSKPYSSNYYSLNGNYIGNFGVVEGELK